ncbi:MAG: lipid-A-disaccharide synthase [Myxococcota bacterium]|nr:lipid-A-disaccharide synthase [bacterium]MDP6074680.1 lipid-A-disaccharide synthase [Myxococcota bacterium]MDP7073016.1 lipid-A-disaccharide synthase [Myxococcota bacterium]MDP7297810.1 lipid-A-disaccharide synthase [Myxococcota bacterium]MDP7431325.1 lipid-A-disaccharide synthase [Myxococcota bacterium]
MPDWQQLDAALFLRINGWDSPAWDMIAGYGTDLGHGAVLALLLGAGLRLADPRRFPKNWLLIGLAALTAGLVAQGLKEATARPRPIASPELAVARQPLETGRMPGGRRIRVYRVGDPELAAISPTLTVLGNPHRYRAFPSGHTTGAFAVAAGLIYAFSGRGRWLWLLPAGFIGLTRVACGAHYPLDVAVGALLGSGVAVGFLRLFECFHGLASPPRAAVVPRPEGPLRVLMVAGEASADRYGARVLTALRASRPQIEAFGIGGEKLTRAGLACEGVASELEVVGFTAVLTRLPTLVRLYRQVLRLLRERRPDVLVCIDLPDFNFMLAQQARARGVPVLFFISPQFWAWRSGRIRKLADRISKMVVAFPFETAYYERAGVPVAFHGHPLLEDLAPRFESRAAARRHFGLDAGRTTVVLAPGSRRSEWHHNGSALLGAAARIAEVRPEVQFVLPLAPHLDAAQVRGEAERTGVRVICVRGDTHDLLGAADFGILCSGTLTLEAALAGLPMLIFYRGNWLNAIVAKLLVETDRIGLPNIVLGGPKAVFPERIQHRARAAELAAEALRILDDPDELAALREATRRVREQLEGGATSRAVAEEALALARVR